MRTHWLGLVMMCGMAPVYGAQTISLWEMLQWGKLEIEKPVRPWGSRPHAEDYLDKIEVRSIKIDMEALGAGANHLKNEALVLGASGGMYHRSQKLERALLSLQGLLDRAFPFEPIMMRNGTVLPPVLSTSVDHMALSENNKILRAAGQSFHIIKQARFVTVTPTWRDYLLTIPYSIPSIPPASSLPTSADEYLAWKVWVTEGWEQGIKNADTVWQINIAKLRRDVLGMYLYHILLARGMVSLPFVEDDLQAVSGDADNLIINDRTLQITALPEMQHNTDNWRTIESLPKLFGIGMD